MPRRAYLLDLCKLTGHAHAGLLCELVNDDPQGSMARRDDCRKFANKHGLKMISVEMIANHVQASSIASGVGGAAS
jgi:3,4-dihydroxy-2-butanone 4-phosphate synthase